MEPMFRSAFGRRVAAALSSIVLMGMIVPVFAFPGTAFAQGVQVSLTPDSGPADTPVTITGSGWSPGAQISVYWGNDSGDVVATAVAGQDGTFTANFNVLQIFTPETDTLHVENLFNSAEATTVSFTVTTSSSSSSTQQTQQVGHPFQPQPDLSSPQQPPSAQLKTSALLTSKLLKQVRSAVSNGGFVRLKQFVGKGASLASCAWSAGKILLLVVVGVATYFFPELIVVDPALLPVILNPGTPSALPPCSSFIK